jgi:hypothetical protein
LTLFLNSRQIHRSRDSGFSKDYDDEELQEGVQRVSRGERLRGELLMEKLPPRTMEAASANQAADSATRAADAAGSADTQTAERQLSELKDHVVTDEGESLLTAALDMGIKDFSIFVRLRF